MALSTLGGFENLHRPDLGRSWGVKGVELERVAFKNGGQSRGVGSSVLQKMPGHRGQDRCWKSVQ